MPGHGVWAAVLLHSSFKLTDTSKHMGQSYVSFVSSRHLSQKQANSYILCTWIFILLLFNFICLCFSVFICLCVCIYVWVPKETRRGHWIPWSWSYRRWSTIRYECWEPTLGPWKEQPTLLPTEPSLQALSYKINEHFWESLLDIIEGPQLVAIGQRLALQTTAINIQQIQASKSRDLWNIRQSTHKESMCTDSSTV